MSEQDASARYAPSVRAMPGVPRAPDAHRWALMLAGVGTVVLFVAGVVLDVVRASGGGGLGALGVWGLLAGWVVVIVVALVVARRGRRWATARVIETAGCVCPWCHYDMVGTRGEGARPAPVCPECGTSFTPEEAYRVWYAYLVSERPEAAALLSARLHGAGDEPARAEAPGGARAVQSSRERLLAKAAARHAREAQRGGGAQG
jgi:hypothetical protein